MGGKIYQELLTNDDRRVHLHEILGHRLKSSGKLDLPNIEQYNKLSTNPGLRAVAYEMCRQIGFKPTGLKVMFDDDVIEAGFRVNAQSKAVYIDPRFIDHPYTCGAVLTLAVTAYAIELFGHEPPDRPFIEFATIETGLGLWILNALRPKSSLARRIYHSIDTSWFHNEGLRLESYSQKQYAERLVSYAHDNRVTPDSYLPHTNPDVKQLLPALITLRDGRYLPEIPIITKHKTATKALWTKILLVSLIGASGITFGIYVAATGSDSVHPEKARLQAHVEYLKLEHQKCQSDASDKLSQYDPNDLFLTRQVDSIKSRCESLRNQYNFTVDQLKLID